MQSSHSPRDPRRHPSSPTPSLPFSLALAASVLAAGSEPLRAQCWSESAKLSASDGLAYDQLGASVALWADTAVVGARFGDAGVPDVGAAYVYERQLDGSWLETNKLLASDPTWFGLFTWSVAIEGDTILVGAPNVDFGAGAVYVFERDLAGPGAWGQRLKLSPPDADPGDQFGHAVALEGDTMVVSAAADDEAGSDAGAVYVFRNDSLSGRWLFEKKLLDSSGHPGDQLSKVALDGDVLVAGTHLASSQAGVAYVFERDQGGPDNWGLVAELDPPPTTAAYWFGRRVAVEGDVAVVGAAIDVGHTQTDSGTAFVFRRDAGGPGNWGVVQQLFGSDPTYGDWFRVDIEAGTIALGGPRTQPPGTDAGAVFVFEAQAGTWVQSQALYPSDGQPDDLFGYALDLQGSSLLVGARWQDRLGTDAGAAYVFDRLACPVTYCTAGTSASGCQATLAASGAASATKASGFVLSALQVEGLKDGLFFYGTSGRQANPWGNGTSYQCVVPPVMRAGLLVGQGSPGQCDGTFAEDLNTYWTVAPQKRPVAGTLVQAQLWYRDPQSTSNHATSLSDALEFTLAP